MAISLRLLLIPCLLSVMSCSFMTSPRVLNVTPEAESNLQTTNLIIELEFSKEMEKISTEQAFSLFLSQDRGSKLKGSFSWPDDLTLRFVVLGSEIDYPAQYVIQLLNSALDRDANALQESFYSTFSLLSNLGRPSVTQTLPRDGETNCSVYSNILITFNLPMSDHETREAFSINPNVAGNISITSNLLTFSPQNPLENGTYYTVSLLQSARDLNGVRIFEDFEFTFIPGQNFMAPQVLSLRTNLLTSALTNHQEGIEKTSTNLFLTFNLPMYPLSVENALKFNPALNFYLTWPNPTNAEIHLLESMLPATNYTLTLEKSAQSSFGKAMKEDYRLHYTTDGPLSTLPRLLSLEYTNVSARIWDVDSINLISLGTNSRIAVITDFSSTRGMDLISLYVNTAVSYILGENGLKLGEINSIFQLGADRFMFVIDKLAVSNYYKISFKGGVNAIQDIDDNHLDKSTEFYFYSVD